ncbi:MAG TPA: hypothetical protein VG309_11905 [Rhizomicrobium sp.]|jgi:hypothetical protein|nr:hypothetical protein [Rhizomicrobium sp.]
MVALKRLFLVIFVLVVPVILTALLYLGTNTLLHATNRVIDPQIVNGAAVVEFVLFFLMSLPELRNRW